MIIFFLGTPPRDLGVSFLHYKLINLNTKFRTSILKCILEERSVLKTYKRKWKSTPSTFYMERK